MDLEAPKTEIQTVQDGNRNIQFCVGQMQGWRPYQEDAFLHKLTLTPDHSLFAIFDGHGGPEVAKYASYHFEKLLIQNELFQRGQYEDALRDVFSELDARMKTPVGQIELNHIRKLTTQSESKDCGSTANVILITPTNIYCANAGDSRSVGSNGKKVFALSNDHKPDLPSETERIKAAGLSVIDGRIERQLGVSRGFGDFRFKIQRDGLSAVICTPEIKVFPRDSISRIIMGSDGIWECQTNIETMKFFDKNEKGKKPGGMIERVKTFFNQIMAQEPFEEGNPAFRKGSGKSL